MGCRPVQASHCSGSSGIMGIMVIDCFSVGGLGRVCLVSCSLRVPAQVIVQPISQMNIATGSSINLISRLRILVFHV